MRVMCTSFHDYACGKGYGHLSEYMEIGDEFTVSRVLNGVLKDGTLVPSYQFSEINSPMVCFDQRNFSPLSGIDENELVNAKEDVYA